MVGVHRRAGGQEPKEGAMILELGWLYVPVFVVPVFWALEIRPLRNLLHPAPLPANRRTRRRGR
jgi:hypothetical protein